MISKILNTFKKSASESISFRTDLHSHLIPSIDDGVKSIEEAIEIILGLQEIGIKKIITTPHIMSHRYANTKQNIQEAYEKLVAELNNQKIDIDLQVASEYYYDEHFLELIDQKQLMTFGDNHILFELSYYTSPLGLEQTVHKLIENGYKPILAHPERYKFYYSKEQYHRLKDMGLLLQINANSYAAFYGKSVKKAVEIVLKEGLVDFVGSDIHSHKYLDSYSQVVSDKNFQKLLSLNNIKNDYL